MIIRKLLLIMSLFFAQAMAEHCCVISGASGPIDTSHTFKSHTFKEMSSTQTKADCQNLVNKQFLTFHMTNPRTTFHENKSCSEIKKLYFTRKTSEESDIPELILPRSSKPKK